MLMDPNQNFADWFSQNAPSNPYVGGFQTNQMGATQGDSPTIGVPTSPAPPQPGPTTGATLGQFTGPANNPNDYKTIWDASNHDPATYVKNLTAQLGIHGAQMDGGAGINAILKGLQAVGINATLDQAHTGGEHKGIYLNGDPNQFVKLLDGSDNWIYQPGGSGSGASAAPAQQPFSFGEQWNEQTPTFQAPSGLTEQNDPGFQARMQMGQDALERSASAKGTLLSGGTLKDEQQFAQDFGSNEYGNVYNRALQGYNTQAQGYNQRYQQYKDRYNQALTNYTTNFGVDQSLWNRAFQENGQGFAQLYDLASLGYNAASNPAAQNFGNNAANLTTGAGNAGAAGLVGGANAWSNAYGNLANMGYQLPAYLSSYKPGMGGI